jgi:diamine N-acetyltransferase
MNPQIEIRTATLDDAAFLADFGAQVFLEAYAAENNPEDMSAYISQAFSPQKQTEELQRSGSVFIIAQIGPQPVGYARLQAGPAPTCITGGEKPIELVRMYSIQSMIGKGVGGRLMQACLNTARAGGFDVVWLSVWQKNERGIAFYRKWGFEIVGTATFTIGSDVQADWIMQHILQPAEGRA